MIKLNKWEREVHNSLLDSESDALDKLERQYKKALNDIVNQVKTFDSDISMLDELLQNAGDTLTDDQKAVLISQRQSKVYQKQYQEALQGQVSGILDKMHSENYATIDEYLKHCYEDAWTGSAYTISQHGIPIITPIDQAAMTRAVLLDSKISDGLYNHLGIDVQDMKKKIVSEISRGISTGMSYMDISRNINNASRAGLANSKRIVRTEGHRIQQASWSDSAINAKAHGADLVRVWSAVLDGRTRSTHRQYDGEKAEVGEPFILNGHKVDYPGEFGIAAEDCNCRCIARSIPRWALGSGIVKRDNFTDELRTFNTPEDYKDFKEKYWSKENIDYMNYVQKMEEKYGTVDFNQLASAMTDEEFAKLQIYESKSPYINTSMVAYARQSADIASPPPEYDGDFYDFSDLTISKEEETTLASLMSKSAETGYEYCSIIQNGKASELKTSNMANAVGIDLDEYGDHLTILHSHTNATPLSSDDFGFLLNPKVDKIGSIGYNGDAFVAYVGDGFIPSLSEYNEVLKTISNQVDRDISENDSFFDWTISERNYMAIREQSYRIARYFGWTLEGGRINA